MAAIPYRVVESFLAGKNNKAGAFAVTHRRYLHTYAVEVARLDSDGFELDQEQARIDREAVRRDAILILDTPTRNAFERECAEAKASCGRKKWRNTLRPAIYAKYGLPLS